jgi:hypothetical protein
MSDGRYSAADNLSMYIYYVHLHYFTVCRSFDAPGNIFLLV